MTDRPNEIGVPVCVSDAKSGYGEEFRHRARDQQVVKRGRFGVAIGFIELGERLIQKEDDVG